MLNLFEAIITFLDTYVCICRFGGWRNKEVTFNIFSAQPIVVSYGT